MAEKPWYRKPKSGELGHLGPKLSDDSDTLALPHWLSVFHLHEMAGLSDLYVPLQTLGVLSSAPHVIS